MKTYEVILAKYYLVTIDAESELEAEDAVMSFTSDIQDISDEKTRANYGFKIQKIECRLNEANSNGEAED